MDAGEQQAADKESARREVEFALLRDKWRIYRPHELAEECQRTGQQYVIDGLIPERSLGLLVGDSGLGKSPLAYQMAICVAAGLPFLGRSTRKGRVLYLDFENGLQDVYGIITRLSRHLGLPAPPGDLILWNVNDCPPKWGHELHTIGDLIREVKPLLVFNDPLSALLPKIESKNDVATEQYQYFRKIIQLFGCSMMNLHHRKKPPAPQKGVPLMQSLEDAQQPRGWFLDARGSSVLVTGTDVRLGVDIPGMSGAANSEIALVMRGYTRVRGEIPTVHLARVFDQDDEPMGYRKVGGVLLLCNPDQETAFGRLPDRFAFKEAKQEYGKGDQATTDFLRKCTARGILQRVARGAYEKVKVAE